MQTHNFTFTDVHIFLFYLLLLLQINLLFIFGKLVSSPSLLQPLSRAVTNEATRAPLRCLTPSWYLKSTEKIFISVSFRILHLKRIQKIEMWTSTIPSQMGNLHLRSTKTWTNVLPICTTLYKWLLLSSKLKKVND